MFEAKDPFTSVQDAVWSALIDSQPLSALVKPRNRQGFTSESYRQPKDSVNDADFPEYQLSQRAFSHSPVGGNSKAAKFAIAFTLLVSSGKLNAEVMNRVVWLATKALSKKGVNLGQPYIEQWAISEPTNTSLTANNPDSDGSLLGWSSLSVIAVSFYVTREELVS